MARGLGSIYKTNKCNCDNPKWEIRDKRKVSSGKQFGKVIYLIYCYSCKTQWETSASYARELESKSNASVRMTAIIGKYNPL